MTKTIATKNKFLEEIARKIRIGRADLGIKQNELAKLVGCSANAICQWEKGESEPSFRFIKKLEKILKVKF